MISTQLSTNAFEQGFMAVELLNVEGPADTDLPTIVMGDFNLDVDGPFSADDVLVDAGFTDAWTATHPGEPGYTCCQAEFLLNDPSTLSARWDVVLSRNGLLAVDAEIVGEEPADRTPSGLWPSDHAGLVVTFAPELPILPGDFNRDGAVDAADYVHWRKNDGTQTGYDTWRANFGAAAGSGTGSVIAADGPAAVPEQATLQLVAAAALAAAHWLRPRHSRRTWSKMLDARFATS